MNPIAEYRETRIDGRRHFQLYTNALSIDSSDRFSRATGHVDLPLNTLRPNFERLSFRHRAFKVGLSQLGYGVAIGALAILLRLPAWAAVIAGVISVVYLFMALVKLYYATPMIRAARFYTEAGVMAADITRSRGEKDDAFERFVAQVQQQINATRAASPTGAAATSQAHE